MDSYPNTAKFEVKVCRGVDRAIELLGVLALDENLVALGIAVDANESPSSRWCRIGEELLSVGIRLKEKPERGGTIIEAQGYLPRIGVWILPDNQTEGELEDLVARMIYQDDPIWPLAKSYVDSIPVEDRPFISTGTKINKAQVYAWLATRKKPGLIGKAIGSEALDTSVEDVRALSRWLARLFPIMND